MNSLTIIKGKQNGIQKVQILDLRKKYFKDYKYNKLESKGNEIKDFKRNFSTSKTNKSNEKNEPPSGCYNWGGDHYDSKYPIKSKTNQSY